MKNNASLVYSFALLVGDFFALVAAFTLAYIIRVKLDPRPLIEQVPAQTYLMIFLVLLPFWLLIFGLLNMYKSEVFENRFSEAARIVVGCFIGILFLLSSEYVIDRVIFPARLVPVYGLGISVLLVLLSRTILRAVRRTLFGLGIGVNRVLLVGDTPITSDIISSLQHTKASGYRVVGVVGESNAGIPPHVRVYKSFRNALTALHVPPHSIVQTEFYADPERNNELLEYAQAHHAAYRFVPGNTDLFTGKIDVSLFQDVPVIAVHQTPLVGWGRIAKRLFDIFAGGLLLLLALPLMILICIALALFDRGPVFFAQKRFTRFNTLVPIYKFRTMKQAYNGLLPEEAFAKMGKAELADTYRKNGDFLEHDPRVSRIGAFLRKTSLDELPQLINVVKGDISLVGPRALVARDLDKSDQKNLILSVKSGLTGLAVISGRKELPYEERRRLDLYYVQHWSFWLDVIILLKTIVLVLRRVGAK